MKILVTGTTRGIGKEICSHFSDNDSYELITINRRESYTDGLAEYICDLTNIDSVYRLCEIIREEHIDILINNAGGSLPVPFERLTTEDVVSRINLNFISPMLLMQAVLPGMKDRNYGRIINISSTTSKCPVPYLHIYSAAKSALDSLTQSLTKYYMQYNICINSICPGGINTSSSIEGRSIISQFYGLSDEDYQLRMVSGNGLGRLLEPKEIVNAIDYLVSEKGDCIKGQTLNVCGCMEMN